MRLTRIPQGLVPELLHEFGPNARQCESQQSRVIIGFLLTQMCSGETAAPGQCQPLPSPFSTLSAFLQTQSASFKCSSERASLCTVCRFVAQQSSCGVGGRLQQPPDGPLQRLPGKWYTNFGWTQITPSLSVISY